MTQTRQRRHRASAGQVVQPCQAEVENLDRPLFLGRKQISRLDVAVDEAVFVGVLQAERRLPYIVACLDRRQSAVLLEEVREIDAVQKLHGEKHRVADIREVDDTDNVRMIQADGGGNLAAETAELASGSSDRC